MGGCPNDPAKVMENLKYMIETLNKTFSCPPTCPAECHAAPAVNAPPQPEFQNPVKQERSVLSRCQKFCQTSNGRQEYQVKENLLIETQPKESQSRKSRLFKFGHPRIYKMEKCRGLSNMKCCYQRNFETELRGSHFIPCLCKRNDGLQDTCQRTGCHGTQERLSCPPCCGPSYFNKTYVGKPILKTKTPYYQIVRKRIEGSGRYVKLIRVYSDSCCEKSCDNAKSKVCTQTMTVSCPYCNHFCKNYDETKRTSSEGNSPENEVLNCSIAFEPKSQITKLEQSVQSDFKTFFISKEQFKACFHTFSNKQSKFVQIEEDSSEYDDSTSNCCGKSCDNAKSKVLTVCTQTITVSCPYCNDFCKNYYETKCASSKGTNPENEVLNCSIGFEPKSQITKLEQSVQSDFKTFFISKEQFKARFHKFSNKQSKFVQIEEDFSEYDDSTSSCCGKSCDNAKSEVLTVCTQTMTVSCPYCNHFCKNYDETKRTSSKGTSPENEVLNCSIVFEPKSQITKLEQSVQSDFKTFFISKEQFKARFHKFSNKQSKFVQIEEDFSEYDDSTSSCCGKSCDNAKSKVLTVCTQTMTVSCPYCNDFCKNHDETNRTSSEGTSPENKALNCLIVFEPKSQITKLEQSVQSDFKTFFISKEQFKARFHKFSNKQSKFVQIEEDFSEYDDSTSSCCGKSCDNAKSKVLTVCTQTMTVSCPYCNDFCKNHDETNRTSSKGTSPENKALNCSIAFEPKSQITKVEQSVQSDFKTFFISKEKFKAFSNKQSKFIQIEEDSSEYPTSDRTKVDASVQSDIEMYFTSNFQLYFMSKKAKETLDMLCYKSTQTDSLEYEDSSKYEDSISSFILKPKTHKSNVDISEESPLKTYFISERFCNNSTFNNHIQLSPVIQSTSATDCDEPCDSLIKLDDSILGKDKLKTSSIELVKRENVIFESNPSSSATITLTTQDNSKHSANIPSALCKIKKVRFESCLDTCCNE